MWTEHKVGIFTWDIINLLLFTGWHGFIASFSPSWVVRIDCDVLGGQIWARWGPSMIEKTGILDQVSSLSPTRQAFKVHKISVHYELKGDCQHFWCPTVFGAALKKSSYMVFVTVIILFFCILAPTVLWAACLGHINRKYTAAADSVRFAMVHNLSHTLLAYCQHSKYIGLPTRSFCLQCAHGWTITWLLWYWRKCKNVTNREAFSFDF